VTSPLDAGTRIRRVVPTDWQAYRDLRLRALSTEPWAFGSTLHREQGFTEAQWRERLTRGSRSNDSTDAPSATWVAVDLEDRFLGMVASARVSGTFHIFAMWVAPERRGQGLAGRLLDEALAWVEKLAPGGQVHLDVNPRAVAAVKLYESRGFRSTGRTERLEHTPSEQVQEMIRPG
jgi:ribosomal protein S18 acetylase RimI-like enzyme